MTLQQQREQIITDLSTCTPATYRRLKRQLRIIEANILHANLA